MSENATMPTPAPKKTATIPTADIDLAVVSLNVARNWQENTWLTLRWTDSAEFSTHATTLANYLQSKAQTRSSRSVITTQIRKLDKKIQEGVKFVKFYLSEKYKEDDLSYYPSFGITYSNGWYTVPTDQNSRTAALELMQAAIVAHGFGDKDYGTAFWADIKPQYDALLSQAGTNDGSVSTMTATKNQHKAYLKKAVNALIRTLQANYPETYKAELRSWGFQKEKY